MKNAKFCITLAVILAFPCLALARVVDDGYGPSQYKGQMPAIGNSSANFTKPANQTTIKINTSYQPVTVNIGTAYTTQNVPKNASGLQNNSSKVVSPIPTIAPAVKEGGYEDPTASFKQSARSWGVAVKDFVWNTFTSICESLGISGKNVTKRWGITPDLPLPTPVPPGSAPQK